MKALLVFGVLGVVSCGSALANIDDPQYLDDASKLANCRAEGRAAKADAGADAGWSAYSACKKDGGF